MKRKLALGTVQFGMNYGAFNSQGKIGGDEVKTLLELAHENGIDLLDTARNYGESEEILGSIPETSKFNLVTKCPPLSASSNPAKALEEHLEASLCALKTKRVYGYLLHQADDLKGAHGKEIWNCLVDLRESGKVTRIGVSAYQANEVVSLLDTYPMTLVQLPAHILSPWIYDEKYRTIFAANDVEIHTRSVFLQGFLLAEPEQLPAHLSKWKHVLAEYRAQAAEMRMEPLQASLAAILAQPMIDKVVVGVNNLAQLRQILATNLHSENITPDAFKNLANSDKNLVDPRFWTQ